MVAKTARSLDLRPPINIESVLDRRRQPRIDLALPVVLFRSKDGIRVETHTKDLSSDSFYCVLDRPFSPGEQLDCEIEIPGDDRGSIQEPGLCLECQVRVVRVVTAGTQKGFGIAFQLEDYSVRLSAS